MIFLKLAYLYFGYLLIYAAVANHGRFATSPWAGVLGDAYGQAGGVKKPGSGNEATYGLDEAEAEFLLT